MKATLKIDPNAEEKFKVALGKIASMASKDLLRIMQEQMVLLIKDAMKLTPPFGNAPITEKLKDQKTIGEIAIRRDLKGGRDGAWSDPKAGIFRPIADDLVDRTMISGIHQNSVTYFTRKDGTSYGSDAVNFRPDATMSDMHTHHQRYRTKSGNVSAAGARTRDIGRWKSTMAWVVRKTTFEDYLEQVFDRVLLAKSGWVYAWNKFQIALGRGRGGGFNRKGDKAMYGLGVPSVLRKMRGAKSGHYVNSGTETSPVIEGGNVIPYVQRFYDHVVKRAWSNRVRNIQLQAKRMEKEIAAALKEGGVNANA